MCSSQAGFSVLPKVAKQMLMKCHTFRARVSALPAAMVLSALAGCAVLPPGGEPPSVTIADFSVASVSLFEQQLNLQLRIPNPNPDEFRIDGVAFDVLVNVQPFVKRRRQYAGNSASIQLGAVCPPRRSRPCRA